MKGEMIGFGEDGRYAGYLARPEGGVGPGALVLHAWWGLNDYFKSVCDRLADAGYVAFAPDLYGNGQIATEVADAERLLEANEGETTQTIALEALRFLVRQPGARPIGAAALGFSMGAAYAGILAALRPGTLRAAVMHYGAWAPDLSKAHAAFLGHFCEEDEWEPRENIEAFRETVEKANLTATFHFYPGVGHWFMEENRPDAYNAEAAELAWARTLAFLAEQLPEKDEPLPRDMAELLARIEQGWGELQGAVAGRSEAELTAPGPEGWSAREHLAHVSFWERLMLLSQIGGQPATEVAGTDQETLNSFDSVNAVVAERARGRSWQAALDDANETHAAVVAKLSGEPFERWMRTRYADDPDERPLMLWIAGNTYGHYAEHAGYIRGILNA